MAENKGAHVLDPNETDQDRTQLLTSSRPSTDGETQRLDRSPRSTSADPENETLFRRDRAETFPRTHTPADDDGKPARTSGSAAFALIFGLLAFVSALTVVLSPLALILSIFGLFLGMAGSRAARSVRITGKALAVSGTVLSVIALIISVAAIAAGIIFLNNGDAVSAAEQWLEQLLAGIPKDITIPKPW
ncbi:hypothetical protein LWF01_16680 [Saxibacter everestensis]|uniref:DUF4190 domain-containing protein n=1 Tax=Saxibacter everestensis TaxID=2909229 RepID=A0ABY8QRT8_9MICO|nr:hypothetical protein LWF01_16680 [Brevibacteriaceae bacterium ZFBP1038]